MRAEEARTRRWRRPVSISQFLAAVLLSALACATACSIPSRPDPPTVDVVPRAQPEQVVAGSWTPLQFMLTAGKRGVRPAIVTLPVPSGWAHPRRSPSAAGHVSSSAGMLVFRENSVSARDVDLSPGSRLTITYGGGDGGATEATVAGRYAFVLSVAAASRPRTTLLRRVLRIQVHPPPVGCRESRGPVGAGQSLILPNGIARPNIYNVRGATGVVRQCYGRAGLSTTITLNHLTPAGPGPIGYPEAAYGYHLFDQPFCGTCRAQPFPLPVSVLLRFPTGYWVTARYSLGEAQPRSLPRD